MTIEEAASYIKKYLDGEIIEIIDGDPETTNKEFMCVITALEVALRSFEAWEKAIKNIESIEPDVLKYVDVKKVVLEIINNALGEVEE